MDVETLFRTKFNVKKDQDIVALIEAALTVAALIVPDKLKKHRSRIIKLLFEEDPVHATDLFSDDELSLDDDDNDGSGLSAKSANDDSKITVAPPNNVCKYPRIKINLKGFKKVFEVSQVAAAPPKSSEKGMDHQDNWTKWKCTSPKVKINLKGFKRAVQASQVAVAVPPRSSISEKKMDHQDNSMELKLEATKRKLVHLYREEAEKKAKRRIECIDFPEINKLCGGGKKVKASGGSVRERLLAKMKQRKQ